MICLPKEQLGVLKSSLKRVRAFQIELELFGSVGFYGEGKTGVTVEKSLGVKERTNNKLNPHMASTPGFEPGPHVVEASALHHSCDAALRNYDRHKLGHGQVFFAGILLT